MTTPSGLASPSRITQESIMPLYENALALIRANLEALQRNERARHVTIGTLSIAQITLINERRFARLKPLPPIDGVIYFIGRHIYDRRILKNGYTIDEVLDQISSALASASQLIPTQRGTLLQNKAGRDDGRGHFVHDIAVLECDGRNPQTQLYSVYPQGDGKGGD